METSIKEFIRKTTEEIRSGIPDGYEISDEIAFDISLISTTTKSGSIKVQIASGDIDKQKQIVHNVNFGIINSREHNLSISSLVKILCGEHIAPFVIFNKKCLCK